MQDQRVTQPQAPAGSDAPRALGSRYLLERFLGSGAMGEVWVARDRESGEQFAAKLLRREFSSDTGIVGRFIQERAILLDLVHPNVVRVRDLVVEGQDLAIIMDLIEGSDLRGLLRERGRLAPAEAVRISVDVLDALTAAHASNILHRDVKPDNVLLDRSEPPFVRLTDFGIARLAQETTVRMTGLLGTAEYMSPEVLTDAIVSPASDVYAVGVLLYELLAGHTPFGGGNPYAVARRHELALPPPLPGLPPALWDSLAGMLAKDPARRRSASATAAELRGLLPGLAGLSALPPLAPPTTWASLEGRTLTSEVPGSVAVRGAEAAPAIDDGRTFIRGNELSAPTPELPVAAPPAGPQQPVWPAALGQPASETNLSGQTMLRPGVPVREKAVDTLDLVEAERKVRPWWKHPVAIVLLLLVVIGGGIGGFLAVSGGKGTPAKPVTKQAASTTIPGQAQPVTYPDGLIISRSAVYDSTDGTLKTTISYAPGNYSLSGQLLEVIPKVTATDPSCPTPTWSGTTTAPSIDLLLNGNAGAACGWDLELGTLASGQTTTVSYTIPFAPATVSTDTINSYLGSAAEQVASDLAQHAQNSPYPAQRIQSMQVLVQGTATANKVVQIEVDPIWVSGTNDGSSPLWSNSATVPPLATAVGGAVQLGSSGPCTLSNTTLGPVFPDPDNSSECVVTATLGALPRASSDPFPVK